MPCYGFAAPEKDFSKRLNAWQRHYMAKGCTDTKARLVAYRKVRAAYTWPPK